MSFNGFTENDFAIFEIPGFEARMPALKAQITPKLKALGEIITPSLREATGQELYPHVAQHLRRTVNAPEETWVAFSRSLRAYKPFVHTRVAINGEGMKIVCHLEDYADDKPIFAAGLKRNARALTAYLTVHPTIHSYDLLDDAGRPTGGSRLDEAALACLADRLQSVKSQHASFAIALARTHPVVGSATALADAAIAGMKTLLPLYLLGVQADYRLEG